MMSKAFPIYAAAPKIQSRASAGIDLVRILAAFFIVWDHAFAPGWQYCDPALTIFLMLTAFLSLKSYERHGSDGFWQKRATRLVLPWLFWCVVFRVILEMITNNSAPWALLAEPNSLLIGPFIHLWFLPFCALCLGFIPLASRYVRSMRALWVASGLLVLVALASHALHADAQLEAPFAQWSLALPLYLWGVLHACARRLGASQVTFGVAVVVSLLSVALWPAFWAAQMAIGAVIFEAAWRLPIKSRWPAIVAPSAFGIYLMHPAFILIPYKFAGADANPALVALFSFAAAFAATQLWRRLPVFQRFV